MPSIVVVSLVFALVAFAMNSILCRQALSGDAIDPATFTAIRIIAGAGCLLAILAARRRPPRRLLRDVTAAAMLFVYAISFSLAYRDLAAGVGALILFAVVQATMIGWGLRCGERLGGLGWMGLVAALAGLVVLAAPNASATIWSAANWSAPSVRGSLLMAAAGVAWAIYSLRGRTGIDPLATTAGNFALAGLPALLLVLLLPGDRHATAGGVGLAVLSGAVASGLGYVAWYAALPHLRATAAATLQLLVPVIAAAGGVLLLAEAITLRLLLAAVLILGGVRLALRKGHPTDRPD